MNKFIVISHPLIFLKTSCMGSTFSLAVGGTHLWELGVALVAAPPALLPRWGWLSLPWPSSATLNLALTIDYLLNTKWMGNWRRGVVEVWHQWICKWERNEQILDMHTPLNKVCISLICIHIFEVLLKPLYLWDHVTLWPFTFYSYWQ